MRQNMLTVIPASAAAVANGYSYCPFYLPALIYNEQENEQEQDNNGKHGNNRYRVHTSLATRTPKR